jgi:hypothetical protein
MSACPKCGNDMKYIEQYEQWFCYTCGQYMSPAESQTETAEPPPQQAPQGPPEGDLEFETVHSPSFTALIFYLQPGQSVVAEKGAMMYMHRTIEIQTHARKGGLLIYRNTGARGAGSCGPYNGGYQGHGCIEAGYDTPERGLPGLKA